MNFRDALIAQYREWKDCNSCGYTFQFCAELSDKIGGDYTARRKIVLLKMVLDIVPLIKLFRASGAEAGVSDASGCYPLVRDILSPGAYSELLQIFAEAENPEWNPNRSGSEQNPVRDNDDTESEERPAAEKETAKTEPEKNASSQPISYCDSCGDEAWKPVLVVMFVLAALAGIVATVLFAIRKDWAWQQCLMGVAATVVSVGLMTFLSNLLDDVDWEIPAGFLYLPVWIANLVLLIVFRKDYVPICSVVNIGLVIGNGAAAYAGFDMLEEESAIFHIVEAVLAIALLVVGFVLF